ncbi:helix-turn-helix domain-containing protein, partial [Burkholderia cepacia]|uniref:helix-turn-helix domain-containing protein n=1 Tax=Burkholderia cepacia TaxID=292 RepID=UPI001592A70C
TSSATSAMTAEPNKSAFPKALAIDYLGTTTLSTEDIASTLGFSDAVGFRHAFKRWTGMTPSDVRRNKRGG